MIDKGSAVIDKTALVRLLCEEVATQERTIRRAADAARENATHEESKPENDKDTRALEASYLAGAQAARARELKAIQSALSFMPLRAFNASDAAALSAIVELSRKGGTVHYFLAPHGGGMKVTLAGITIAVVTPESPIGRALLGCHRGDEISLNAGAAEVLSIV